MQALSLAFLLVLGTSFGAGALPDTPQFERELLDALEELTLEQRAATEPTTEPTTEPPTAPSIADQEESVASKLEAYINRSREQEARLREELNSDPSPGRKASLERRLDLLTNRLAVLELALSKAQENPDQNLGQVLSAALKERVKGQGRGRGRGQGLGRGQDRGQAVRQLADLLTGHQTLNDALQNPGDPSSSGGFLGERINLGQGQGQGQADLLNGQQSLYDLWQNPDVPYSLGSGLGVRFNHLSRDQGRGQGELYWGPGLREWADLLTPLKRQLDNQDPATLPASQPGDALVATLLRVQEKMKGAEAELQQRLDAAGEGERAGLQAAMSTLQRQLAEMASAIARARQDPALNVGQVLATIFAHEIALQVKGQRPGQGHGRVARLARLLADVRRSLGESTTTAPGATEAPAAGGDATLAPPGEGDATPAPLPTPAGDEGEGPCETCGGALVEALAPSLNDRLERTREEAQAVLADLLSGLIDPDLEEAVERLVKYVNKFYRKLVRAVTSVENGSIPKGSGRRRF